MRKKLKFIGTDTVIAAIFILTLLNFSYVQNNKNRKELVVPGTIKFLEHSNRVETVPSPGT